MYFNGNDNICYPLEYHLDEAKENGVTSIELVQADLDKTKNKYMAWCSEYCHQIYKSECNKIECGYFEQGIGRFCNFRGKLYTRGVKVIFDVKTGKKLRKETNNVTN